MRLLITRTLANHAARMAQYRLSLALWGIGNALRTLVMLNVWIAAAGADGRVGELDVDQLVVYFLAVIVIDALVGTDVVWGLAHDIRTGRLGQQLAQPVHPFWYYRLSGYVVYGIQLVFVYIPVIALLAWIYRPAWGVDPLALVLVIPVILLGQSIYFVVMWMLGALGFWTPVGGFSLAALILIDLVSGGFAPIELLPGAWGDISRMLPFYWTIGYPAELVTGTEGITDVPRALAIQGAWLVALLVLARWQWARGLARHSAVGA